LAEFHGQIRKQKQTAENEESTIHYNQNKINEVFLVYKKTYGNNITILDGRK
jgi:hypothetical protein